MSVRIKVGKHHQHHLWKMVRVKTEDVHDQQSLSALPIWHGQRPRSKVEGCISISKDGHIWVMAWLTTIFSIIYLIGDWWVVRAMSINITLPTPTRARLFISPSTWVPPSPSPWTPGVRQWMALWKRRRAPLLRGEMPGAEKNSSARRGKLLQLWTRQWNRLLLPCFPVTIVTTQMFLKRGWGNIWGWSMENPNWTLSYNPLLPPLPRSSENQQVTAMHWLCPLLETQPGSSLATIVIKTCLQTTSVQRTVVADVMKYLVVTKNWPITKELFIQTCVTYASKCLLMKIPFWHTFGKNTWTIDFSLNALSAKIVIVTYRPVWPAVSAPVLLYCTRILIC